MRVGETWISIVKPRLTGLWDDILYVARRYSADGCGFMAAAIAFYAFFALFPFTLVVLTVVAHLVDPASIQDQLITGVEFYLPHLTPLVEENIRRLLALRTRMGLAGLLALYWASSGVFAAIQTALNRVWGIPPHRSLILRKAQHLAVSGFLTALISLAVLGQTALKAAQSVADSPLAGWNTGSLGLVLPFIIMVFLFSLAYRALPNTGPCLHSVLAGGLVGGAGAEFIRILFTWYVSTLTPYTLVYGSLGVVIALLFWVYLTAVAFLVGAQVASVVDHRRRLGRAAKKGPPIPQG